MQKLRARKGFTLVELLIVIVIIGILVGAMLLSSGSATDTAKASAIVSGLRNLKGAAIMFLADNIDMTESEISAAGISALAKYMDKDKDTVTTGFVLVADAAEGIFVGANVDGAGVRDKLAGQAKSAGLMNSHQERTDNEIADNLYTSADSVAYVRVR
ncbi:hypothetical protein FACS1894187_19510 [Synergistales bacterium]|nr:hypothetical protein FACS1894187_19510 [Synergistales bacterium]